MITNLIYHVCPDNNSKIRGNMEIQFINEPTMVELLRVIKYVNRNLKLKSLGKIATNAPLSDDHAVLWFHKYKIGEQIYSIAIWKDKVVGVSHLDVFHGRRNHGGKLAITIDADFRGKGIGNLLLKNMICQCKKKGISIIRAEPTEDNVKMIQLLEKNNFIVEGRAKKAFNDDEKGLIDLIEYTLFI